MVISRRAFLQVLGLGAGAILLQACQAVKAGTAATNMPSTGMAGGRSWRVVGERIPGLAEVDSAVKAFMQRRDISAGMLAVTWNGKLVLAHAYQWDVEENDPIQLSSRFRLADLSQVFTATAVLRLVQDGNLSLESRLVDIVDPVSFGVRPSDAGWKKITVEHLLRHQAGWDRNATFDPLFSDRQISLALSLPLPVDEAAIVRYMLGQPLQYRPGERSIESHFGYLLLKQVVATASGQGYVDYVQNEVFTPLGIERLGLGHSTLAERLPEEVMYISSFQGQSVLTSKPEQIAMPYGGFNLENLSGSAGWVAPVLDLGRWLRSLANWEDHPVLSRASLERMFDWQPDPLAASSTAFRAGCGWWIRGSVETWEAQQTGSLPGAFAHMARLAEGWAYAVVFNQSEDASDPTGSSYADIAWILERALRAVASPPEQDLIAG